VLGLALGGADELEDVLALVCAGGPMASIMGSCTCLCATAKWVCDQTLSAYDSEGARSALQSAVCVAAIAEPLCHSIKML
jgi:hypothetical protein